MQFLAPKDKEDLLNRRRHARERAEHIAYQAYINPPYLNKFKAMFEQVYLDFYGVSPSEDKARLEEREREKIRKIFQKKKWEEEG